LPIYATDVRNFGDKFNKPKTIKIGEIPMTSRRAKLRRLKRQFRQGEAHQKEMNKKNKGWEEADNTKSYGIGKPISYSQHEKGTKL
jgi:hypothetical protein